MRLAARGGNNGGHNAHQRMHSVRPHVHMRRRRTVLERPWRRLPRPAAAAAATAAVAGSNRDLLMPLRRGAARVVVPVSVREGSISRGREKQRASSSRAGGGGAPSSSPPRRPEATPEGGDSNSWSSGGLDRPDDRAAAAEQLPTGCPVWKVECRRAIVERPTLKWLLETQRCFLRSK